MNAPHKPAPSFAGVSYGEAIERARKLVPVLRSRAAAAEAARTMSEETIADLHASGLIRTMQPRRWGGMEFDYVAYVDFPLELSRGDASAGWNLANLQIHHWMLALYDGRAQEEVWGANPDALIASGIAFPQGSGRKADGGFVVGRAASRLTVTSFPAPAIASQAVPEAKYINSLFSEFRGTTENTGISTMPFSNLVL